MEGDSHNSVGVVEGLLNSVAVVDVDVQVEHSRVDLQQLQDADYDIVDVAEAAGLRLLGVVVAASPVNGHVGDTCEDDVSSVYAASCGQLAEMIQSVEARAVKTLVNFEETLEFGIVANLPLLVLLILRDDLVLLAGDPLLEVVDVGRVVEEGEFVLVGLLALEHVEVFAEFVALDEAVGHLDAFGLHGVFLAEVVVGDGVVVEVAHAPHCSLNIITTLEHNPPLIAYRTTPLYSHHYMQTHSHLYPAEDHSSQVVVAVPGFAERKAKLSTFTVYTIRGEDKEGAFEYEKRYSDFDHFRPLMVQRWPGCFVPPLPKKKVVGNSDAAFVEERRIGLEIFLKDLAKLNHLWYSREFQTFLRSSGDIEKQLKNLPHENHEDIIKKYDEVFPKLKGRSEDTMTLARVLDFGNYIKKILPNFKEMSLSFIEAKNANAEQFSVLLNYVLPEYEKSCLSVYCNQITEGKFIFNEKNDERLAGFIATLKELMAKQEFEGLYHNLELEEREVEAFLEIYKGRDHYDQKLKDLKSREKDLELELVKLNAGKQGMFSSLMSSVEKDKAKANKQIESVKEDIKVYSFLNDLIIILLGHFEIERFRKDKLELYFATIKKIAIFQIQFNDLRRQICDHILENHNLL